MKLQLLNIRYSVTDFKNTTRLYTDRRECTISTDALNENEKQIQQTTTKYNKIIASS